MRACQRRWRQTTHTQATGDWESSQYIRGPTHVKDIEDRREVEIAGHDGIETAVE